jgi:hypothetical protein
MTIETLQQGGCPTIMDGKNLTPQNAPGSTIGNLGGVLLPPKNADFCIYRTTSRLQGIVEFNQNIKKYKEL